VEATPDDLLVIREQTQSFIPLFSCRAPLGAQVYFVLKNGKDLHINLSILVNISVKIYLLSSNIALGSSPFTFLRFLFSPPAPRRPAL
jgi:hypothetical protein